MMRRCMRMKGTVRPAARLSDHARSTPEPPLTAEVWAAVRGLLEGGGDGRGGSVQVDGGVCMQGWSVVGTKAGCSRKLRAHATDPWSHLSLLPPHASTVIWVPAVAGGLLASRLPAASAAAAAGAVCVRTADMVVPQRSSCAGIDASAPPLLCPAALIPSPGPLSAGGHRLTGHARAAARAAAVQPDAWGNWGSCRDPHPPVSPQALGCSAAPLLAAAAGGAAGGGAAAGTAADPATESPAAASARASRAAS